MTVNSALGVTNRSGAPGVRTSRQSLAFIFTHYYEAQIFEYYPMHDPFNDPNFVNFDYSTNLHIAFVIPTNYK